mgnify:CR=1 FL=1
MAAAFKVTPVSRDRCLLAVSWVRQRQLRRLLIAGVWLGLGLARVSPSWAAASKRSKNGRSGYIMDKLAANFMRVKVFRFTHPILGTITTH